MDVTPDRLLFRISIHERADIVAAHEFWSDVVGVPPTEFQRVTLKRHKPKTNRRNVGEEYHGCVVVTVRRPTTLYRQIAGWWLGVVDGSAEAIAGTMTTQSGMV